MIKEEIIKGRKITYYGDINSSNIIIQPIDDHDGSLMDSEISFVTKNEFGVTASNNMLKNSLKKTTARKMSIV